jgi:hypothetical protein
MGEDSARFIDLALRSFEQGSAARDQAATELYGRIAYGGTKRGDDEITQAIGRLQASRPASRRALPLLIGTGVLILVVLIALSFPRYISDYRVLGRFHRFFPGDFAKQQEFTAKRGESLWLHEPPLTSKPWKHPSELLQRAKARFEENPSDPAFYQQYVAVHLMIEKTLPPAYRETWQRIDPGNALWPLIESAAVGGPALARNRGTRWKIIDAEAFERSVAAFREAARSTRFRDYQTALAYRQRASFPPPASLADAQIREFYSGLPFLTIHATEPIRAMFDDLANKGDTLGFEALLSDWKQVTRLLFKDIELDDSVKGTSIIGTSVLARELAGQVPDPEEEGELRILGDLASAIEARHWVVTDAASETAVPHSATRYQFPGPRKFLLDLGGDPFKARRMAEYSLVDRFGFLAVSILAILALLMAAISAFSRGSSLGGLARGLAPLFRPVDHGLLLVLGLIAPVLFWCAVVHLSPFGCRDMALDNSAIKLHFQPWLLQMAALYVLVSVSLFQTTRWRWSKRAGFLSLRPAWLAAGWIMVLLAAAAVPAFGLVRYWPSESGWILLAVASLAGIPLLWLCWHAMAMLFAPRAGALRAILTTRSLLPAKLAFAVLLLAGAFQMERREHYWMAEDVKNEIDVTRPDASRFKGEVGKEIQRRVMEALAD